MRTLFKTMAALMLAAAGLLIATGPLATQWGHASDDPPVATAPAIRTVDILAYCHYFAPTTVTIDRGTTVRWLNSVPIPHTVTSDDGRWDSGVIRAGYTYSNTFTQPGIYYYHSRYNPSMGGSVVVR